MTAVAMIACVVACGTSSTPSATTSPSAPTTTSSSAPTATACAQLGGTVGPDQICKVHTVTPAYMIDITFPVDYPDQQALIDALTRRRNEFMDTVHERPHRDVPYALDMTGKAYRSSNAGTASLVFKEYIEVGAAHPETYFVALNYDLSKRVPITFDTLFKPGTNPVAVLDPIVQTELAKRLQGTPVDDNTLGAQMYQNFAITDAAVIFFIGQGMWTVEAAGPQEISVPRSELAAILA
jgi:hypothetical protein